MNGNEVFIMFSTRKFSKSATLLRRREMITTTKAIPEMAIIMRARQIYLIKR